MPSNEVTKLTGARLFRELARRVVVAETDEEVFDMASSLAITSIACIFKDPDESIPTEVFEAWKKVEVFLGAELAGPVFPPGTVEQLQLPIEDRGE